MRITRLADLSANLEKRKRQFGIVGNNYVLKNSGANRTPEKRALLQWIKNESERKGKKPPFDANFYGDLT